MNVTGWYDGRQSPMRPGIYQRKLPSGLVIYSSWSGSAWLNGSRTLNGAENVPGWAYSDFQRQPWRGLTTRSGK